MADQMSLGLMALAGLNNPEALAGSLALSGVKPQDLQAAGPMAYMGLGQLLQPSTAPVEQAVIPPAGAPAAAPTQAPTSGLPPSLFQGVQKPTTMQPDMKAGVAGTSPAPKMGGFGQSSVAAALAQMMPHGPVAPQTLGALLKG